MSDAIYTNKGNTEAGVFINSMMRTRHPGLELVGYFSTANMSSIDDLRNAVDAQLAKGYRVGKPVAGAELTDDERKHVSAVASAFGRANGIPDPFNATTDQMIKSGVVGVYAKKGSMETIACDSLAS